MDHDSKAQSKRLGCLLLLLLCQPALSIVARAGIDDACQRAGDKVGGPDAQRLGGGCPDDEELDRLALGRVFSSLNQFTSAAGMLASGRASAGDRTPLEHELSLFLELSRSFVPNKLTCVLKNGTITLPVKVFPSWSSVSVEITQDTTVCLSLTMGVKDKLGAAGSSLDSVEANPACIAERIPPGLTDLSGFGSCLVKFAIEMATRGGDQYIYLWDVSSSTCPGANGKSYSLKQAKFLTTGDTWYGSFGFTPGKSPSSEAGDKARVNAMRKVLSEVPLETYRRNFPSVRFEDFASPQEALANHWRTHCNEFADQLKEFWSGIFTHPGDQEGNFSILPPYWHLRLKK